MTCRSFNNVASFSSSAAKFQNMSRSDIATSFLRVLSSGSCRHLSITSTKLTDGQNHDYHVSPVYQNRNPRNLEKMALARKRIGWQFQAPRRDYYHKLFINKSQRHTEAWIEHFSGEKILSASTKEWAIRNQLYSCTDVTASVIVGQALAQRCLESGITCVFFDDSDLATSSEKMKCLLQAFHDANISLKEPDVIEPEHKPGINYDGFNRYAEPKVWKEDYQDI